MKDDDTNKAERMFLLERKSLILEGLDYIDSEIYRPNFLEALDSMGWRCVIVPDEEWCPSKHFPTETSADQKETRILQSYLQRNPNMFGYLDSCGWAYHELVHAAIFSGRFPYEFLKRVSSPFDYPLNTDEVFCYGYQLKKLISENRVGRFTRNIAVRFGSIRLGIHALTKALFNQNKQERQVE